MGGEVFSLLFIRRRQSPLSVQATAVLISSKIYESSQYLILAVTAAIIGRYVLRCLLMLESHLHIAVFSRKTVSSNIRFFQMIFSDLDFLFESGHGRI